MSRTPENLQPITQAQLDSLVSQRKGETKLGEKALLLDTQLPYHLALQQAQDKGAKFAIVGISEDIGPRGNLGRGGALNALEASLKQLLNMQSNRFLSGEECLLIGDLDCHDLQLPASANEEQLRQNVAKLDNRVIALITPIIEAGLEPIVIGGGHNNAFGLLCASKQAKGRPMAAVNLDPHCDFRPREGRHSGNGFSYAAANGSLSFYHILGLHEQKNSEASLAQLEAFGGSWHSLQDIWFRKRLSLDTALKQIAADVDATGLPLGLELDLDAIYKMPSSASTCAGIPLVDACTYVYHLAHSCNCSYLHLAEGAPSCHEAGVDAGNKEVGQSCAELMLSYIQGRLDG